MTTENEIKNYPSIKQSWGIAGLNVLFAILFSVVYILLKKVVTEDIAHLLYYLLSMGCTFWVIHVKRKKVTNIGSYNFDFSSPKVIVFACIAVIGIQIGTISPIVTLMPMPKFMQNVFLRLADQNVVLSFISLTIAAPIMEELIFRGIMLDGLLKRYSPVKSIVVSSALFGIVHLNPWQFVGALIVGIFSGWVYYKTKHLTLSILIHASNNLIAFVSLRFLDVNSFNKPLTELYGGAFNFIAITFVAIVVAAVCLYFLNKEFRSTAANLDGEQGHPAVK
ncbi:CPBP family intramembrane glutamic endopeptidase [Ohtaekwangia sp.]|uniref:CPBP family intramembrane glutamic endopeptidase n=1 Tax=Ohtaekwangia sp. TaxID=2066019 RepID=UPI002FDC7B28